MKSFVFGHARLRCHDLPGREPNLDAGSGVFSAPIARLEEGEYVARGHADAVRQAVADGHEAWAGSLCWRLRRWPSTGPRARSCAEANRRGGSSWLR